MKNMLIGRKSFYVYVSNISFKSLQNTHRKFSYFSTNFGLKRSDIPRMPCATDRWNLKSLSNDTGYLVGYAFENNRKCASVFNRYCIVDNLLSLFRIASLYFKSAKHGPRLRR